ncbi:kelch motif-containing protein [Solwaraspora sp. WMMD406]|uniref:kelch motif-containing protein n=1 Tax=Solwaraspora sp. WMMD406 TaxID=3016095 RepID=UPI002417422E|nr:kelch motif-containing protein [Solwaraspora sp. WMMD406]MDG4767735.1 kelch motif-containing protein [Solwaraspora sp. WMMD406]
MNLPSAAAFRQRVVLPVVGVSILLGANVPPIYDFTSGWLHERTLNSIEYQREHGYWQVLELPEDQRVNAIHAALLPTGKVLLIAGSGNDREQFDAGTFKTLLFDPASGDTELVPTPADVFCAGHSFLPDGKLLVAGGTLRYEVLEEDVERAGGTMVVKNESPEGAPRAFVAGTEFVAPDGRRYTAANDFVVPPATKTVELIEPGDPDYDPEYAEHADADHPAERVTVTASETAVWVDAAGFGDDYLIGEQTQYRLQGLAGSDAQNIYGLAESITMEKQDYQGLADAYEFDPWTERYERVDDMHEKRWYPTLTGLPDGQVLTVSGLDGGGKVLDGSQNEMYDPATKSWTLRPDLERYFPTYPSLFQTAEPDLLFYSGSNAGYGPDDQGRDPGFWDLSDNSFTEVDGLRDTDQLETSMSAWVGPVQEQRIMVVGGGGIGESELSTDRIDLIDLDAAAPRFTPGPDLPEGTRYPNLVQLPDDTVLITNGSRDYRGRGDTDNHTARIYHPDTDTLAVAADPRIGRNYHAAALLLPDGRVLTVGSDPLFRDAKNSISGEFEQRLELYSPPYLFRGERPLIGGVPEQVTHGERITVSSPDADRIETVRLIRPGAATHMLNNEQRSVAVDFTVTAGGLELTVPTEATILLPGPYLLFAVDADGVPSVGVPVLVN